MARRFFAIAVCIVLVGVGVWAAEQATFVLTDGQRKSGPVVFHGGQGNNLIDDYLNLGAGGGREQTFPIGQVAVIDFVGGQPPNSELQALPRDGSHMIALRNGAVVAGHFINIRNGTTVIWQNSGGAPQDLPINQVSRIYLNPQSARTVYRFVDQQPQQAAGGRDRSSPGGQAGPGGQSGPGDQSGRRPRFGDQAGGGGQSGGDGQRGLSRRGGVFGQRGLDTIRVNGNTPWVDTGIDVQRGDRIAFNATGEVSGAPGRSAGPEGIRNLGGQYPVPNAAGCALIGRIGNGPAFAIGANTQPIVMNGRGPLMLGINDDFFGDNGGSFAVTIMQQ